MCDWPECASFYKIYTAMHPDMFQPPDFFWIDKILYMLVNNNVNKLSSKLAGYDGSWHIS